MPRLLPNWLEAYLVYTHASKSPEIFHLWCGISIIAGALQRHVWFDMAYYKLYPNMYVVLVSPPGRCAKSTAMAIARGTTKQIETYPFAVESTSREKLIKNMSMSFHDGQSAINVHASEFASFFATSAEKMLVFLTDIYFAQDDWTHETISGSTSKIRAPFLNLLAGTTPESLQRDVPVEAIGVGLTSRICFVYEDTPRVRPWRPQLTQDQKDLGEALSRDLKHIHDTIKGEYLIDDSFDRAFGEWEEAHTSDPNPTGDDRLAGYFERKPDHIKKLCMILAAARKDDLILTAEDFALALDTIERVETRLTDTFQAVGRNPLSRDINEIFAEILSDRGGTTVGEIYIKFQHALRQDEIEEALTTLQVQGKIVLRGGRYYTIANAHAIDEENKAS